MTLAKILRTSAAALGALAVATVSQANAADIYSGGGYKEPAYIPPPLWTGFYFGAHAGIDWAHLELNEHEFFDDVWIWNPDGPNFRNSVFFPGQNNTVAGGFAGGQFGYNFQYGPTWVFGVEVDLGAMSVNNRFHDMQVMNDKRVAAVEFDEENNNNFRFYGDVTGRIGYTWGAAMIYAKGGFAFLESNLNMRERIWWNNSPTGNAWDEFNNNNNNFLTGWTVGGGIEWKVSPSWSIKAEYLHFDFTNLNENCCNDVFVDDSGNHMNNFNNNRDLIVDTVKIGFNYFWITPPAPLK
jgi:opacity protein-like surface antigen